MVKLFGPLCAIAMILLGALAAMRARSPQEVAEGLRALGTLSTVVTGVLSAFWWHQSADLSNPREGDATASAQSQRDANVLSAAAATATGLALLGGVFSGVSGDNAEAALSGIAFLLLLAMSGSEIWLAGSLSVRQALRPRAVLAMVMLTMAILLFVVRRILKW